MGKKDIDNQKETFSDLKEKLMTGPILVVPDSYKPFVVECDACGDSIGAMLQKDGHVVAYESRRLRDAELYFGVYEKELLAVIHALTNWKHYLLGADFVVMKDGYLMKDDCLCITRGMRQKIMDECHAPLYARHRGIASTTQALERYFYWPRMRKDLHQYVTECLTC